MCTDANFWRGNGENSQETASPKAAGLDVFLLWGVFLTEQFPQTHGERTGQRPVNGDRAFQREQQSQRHLMKQIYVSLIPELDAISTRKGKLHPSAAGAY